jgi:hypothetical protein
MLAVFVVVGASAVRAGADAPIVQVLVFAALGALVVVDIIRRTRGRRSSDV